MDSGWLGSGPLIGSEIHGFYTWEDLEVSNMMEEAKSRWLRPNEIHAILCNYKYFSIHVKPVNLPKSGAIVLFDRKVLRNFRKDGHNWKKKKDGKTVKEAHEHLKVGDEERIHVYYAHGQDSPSFVRRCYWLLDKTLEHIVLVHYRDTLELQGSPATPVISNSSAISDKSTPLLVTEEFDSAAGNNAYYEGENAPPGSSNSSTIKNHEMRLHEINTLEWDELLVTNNANESTVPSRRADKVSCFDHRNQVIADGVRNNGASIPAYNSLTGTFSHGIEPLPLHNDACLNISGGVYNQISSIQVNSNDPKEDTSPMGTGHSLEVLLNDGLQSQDSFGRWMNSVMSDTHSSVHDPVSSISSSQDSLACPEQIFNVTDVSLSWAWSTEKTKILVTGFFNQAHQHLVKSHLFCVCGDICIPVEIIQVGVYRCFLPPHAPGLMSLYMSLDGHKPISQVLSFEYRASVSNYPITPAEDEPRWEEFQLQLRLAYLLFSTSKCLNILSSKVSPNNLKEAKKFSLKTIKISNSWAYLIKSIEENRASFREAKDSLFEITLKNRLKDWLLERIIEGCKTMDYDPQGQSVLHLCAILGYTWAIYLFSWSGLSLDFRDKHGWTALHWAAYYGQEKMVAVLLSAGAKPNLVTDPTAENPGGCTASDLASMKGYDGLAAYLSEESLVAQFNAMAVAGNASGSLQTSRLETENVDNINEDELYLKETLAAYRTVADAAARIQTAFREHSLKIRTKAVRTFSPEDEARNIVAALKIQHAFRSYEIRKKMAAASRIQYRFRTWKIRKEFLNMRCQAIKIQAAFRGFQTRRQYQKIIWSVGVLEKAVLRWRLRRKGFRGLEIHTVEPVADQRQENEAEEDFYRTSQKQAEERVEKAVVQVQSMFRSKQAQKEYRRMKMAHELAKIEYESLLDPLSNIDS